MSILVYGDSTNATLRHELPLPLADPVAYLEHDDSRIVFAHELELSAIRAVGDINAVSLEELGLEDELLRGQSFADATAAALRRGCEKYGVRTAVVPEDFPLGLARVLMSSGMELQTDAGQFSLRRRVKSPSELSGIQRAQRAAAAAAAAIRDRIATGEATDAAALRQLARGTLTDNGAVAPDLLIVACGQAGASPHEEGAGPVRPHEPIVVDVAPRDLVSGCWGDFTRTFCLGTPPDRLRQCHEDVLAALHTTVKAVKPGVTGEELDRVAAQCLRDRGHPTKLDTADHRAPAEGFVHGVGHGVGLQVHEAPILEAGRDPLIAGDVVAIEPGVYYGDLGGVRIEDLLLVTEEGCESVIEFPYQLEIG